MKFSELRLKGGRNYAKGEFQVVDVGGASMFVGTVSEVRDDDARQNDPRPKHKRIAYPVSSVEYAVPMAEDVTPAANKAYTDEYTAQVDAELADAPEWAPIRAGEFTLGHVRALTHAAHCVGYSAGLSDGHAEGYHRAMGDLHDDVPVDACVHGVPFDEECDGCRDERVEDEETARELDRIEGERAAKEAATDA